MNIREQCQMLLRAIGAREAADGRGHATVSTNDVQAFRLGDRRRIEAILNELGGQDLISFDTPRNVGGRIRWPVRLTTTGQSLLKGMNRLDRGHRRAFVALWFDPSMNRAWSSGFSRAISSLGFKAERVDELQHNDKICEVIMDEIREAAFLVADCTGARNGVYFEAGLALGQGVPVIWTCREDWIGQLHFDTRQFNHIIWRTPKDLHKKLAKRITTTIGSSMSYVSRELALSRVTKPKRTTLRERV